MAFCSLKLKMDNAIQSSSLIIVQHSWSCGIRVKAEAFKFKTYTLYLPPLFILISIFLT